MIFFTALKDKITNTLIPEWKHAWKMLSIQLSAIGTAASSAWLMMTDDQRGSILGIIGINGPSVIALVAFTAIILGRLKAQASIPDTSK